jgi:hypothetical protein
MERNDSESQARLTAGNQLSWIVNPAFMDIFSQSIGGVKQCVVYRICWKHHREPDQDNYINKIMIASSVFKPSPRKISVFVFLGPVMKNIENNCGHSIRIRVVFFF